MSNVISCYGEVWSKSDRVLSGGLYPIRENISLEEEAIRSGKDGKLLVAS